MLSSQHRHAMDHATEQAVRGDFNDAILECDRETLSVAIAFSREKRDFAGALDYAERLARLVPQDPTLFKLIEELRQRKSAPGP